MRIRCYLVTAHAPQGTTLKEANELWNAYIADRRRGHCVFHDHFQDSPGGVAVIEAATEEQQARLYDLAGLPGWQCVLHPLIYAQSAAGFVQQTAYTSGTYAGVPLQELLDRLARARAAGTDLKRA
ncbi:hypothetical protein EV586_101472 [Tumebacillus sp. BK434]|uniref:hypothetical protein n=1 Tax=Tumebacillus sp. BK434 TaxID=2512169 RepID=UPI001053F1F4|nr:hypothetical protein [Tumebacillus sp. BK434]TCP59256.1 hypothetical protein EV586_101472 [Tumebacillus sp. BK434]